MRLRLRRKKFPINKSQMELELERPFERDRNHKMGGKSFYFFDFDDNVAYLTTSIIIFHKKTNHEIPLSSGEWANHHTTIGKSGDRYEDYYIDYEDTGSFRNFRDVELGTIQRFSGKKQSFLYDIESALRRPDYLWKAPSWSCFYHATFNRRPISVITARGHKKETIKRGIDILVDKGHIPWNPNYLSVFPVTNPQVREELGDDKLTFSVADLKQKAIRQSVELAIQKYGNNPHHRFGMSDDDPNNVELITEEMKCLKELYPDMSFFVIQTFKDYFVKTEVYQQAWPNQKQKKNPIQSQLDLF